MKYTLPDKKTVKLTDFNDLHKYAGLDEVRRQLFAALNTEPLSRPQSMPEKKSEHENKNSKKSKKISEAVWESPVLFGRSEVPEISPDILPPNFSEYATALADSLQVPPAMVVLYSLAVLSTALQKKFVVHGGGDYYEIIAMWVVLMMDSGERKSPVIQALTKPLFLWEKNRNERERMEIFENETKRTVNQKRIEKLRNDAAKEDGSGTRETILKEIQQLGEELPEERKPTRIFTGDTTPEKFQQMLVEQRGRMAILSDEGGFFAILAGIYSGGESYLDPVLQGYSGSPIRVHRASREAIIDKPALTLGIAIQPQLIRDMRPEAKRRFRSSGLFARCLFGMPSGRVGKRNMRLRTSIPEELKTKYRNHVLHLLDIEPTRNEDGEEVERVLTLSDEARSTWEGFAQWVENEQAEGCKFESLRDWCAKIAGGCLRVAGLFHVAEHSLRCAVIDRATMTRAVALCESLIPHAAAVFDLVGDDPAIDDAKVVWRWIEQHRTEVESGYLFKRSDIHKQYRSRFPTLDRLTAALDVLSGRNLIAGPFSERTEGRPSIFYTVNPRALRK